MMAGVYQSHEHEVESQSAPRRRCRRRRAAFFESGVRVRDEVERASFEFYVAYESTHSFRAAGTSIGRMAASRLLRAQISVSKMARP